MLFACLALIAPWLVEEIQQFIRNEVKKILQQQAAGAGVGEAQLAGATRSISEVQTEASAL